MSDYNGWTNYETWCVKLWIDKEFVTDPDNGLIPDLGATLAADLLNAALSEVDWREIAENMLEDFQPEEEGEAV